MFLHSNNVCPSVRPSFSSTLDRVMQQVEYHCFSDLCTKWTDPLYMELCFIITEVFIMEPESVIKINGSDTLTRLVQEVFALLRNDHVRLVLSNFQDVSCRVYNKKSYLRTALYNAVFEIESHFVNTGNSS